MKLLRRLSGEFSLKVFALLLLLAIALGTAFGQVIERPVVYVHGLCGDPFSFSNLHNSISSDLHANAGNGFYANTTEYIAYFDNSIVYFYPVSNPNITYTERTLPSNARFFAVRFYDPRPSSVSSNNSFTDRYVADVPIITKANELAQIISSIRYATGNQDVLAISHSMGGLVTRTYIEGLASPVTRFGPTTTITSSSGQTQAIQQFVQFSPGATRYAGDVGALVTLDAPHAGAIEGNWPTLNIGCAKNLAHLNVQEMVPGGSSDPNVAPMIPTLNYHGSIQGVTPTPLSQATIIRALASTTNNVIPIPPFNVVSDGILGQATQDIRQALSLPPIPTPQSIYSWSNYFSLNPCGPFALLHPLSCLAAQNQTLNYVKHLVRGPSINGMAVSPIYGGSITVPSIASILPSPVLSSTPNIKIFGNGFTSTSSVVLRYTPPVGPTQIFSNFTQVNVKNNIQLTFTASLPLGAWTAQVGNLNQVFSSKYSFSVTASPPSISSINPNPMTGRSYNQPMTLYGSGFQSGTGLGVRVGYPGFSTVLSGTQIVSVSPAQIQVLINVGTTARIWTAQVINPDGQQSNIANFSVIAPIAISASVSPSVGFQFSTNFTITGAGATPFGRLTATDTWPDGTQHPFSTSATSSGAFTFGPFVSIQFGGYSSHIVDNTTGSATTVFWTVYPFLNAYVTPSFGTRSFTYFNIYGSGATPNGTVQAVDTWPDGSRHFFYATADSSGQVHFGPFQSSQHGNYQSQLTDLIHGASTFVYWTVY